MQFNKIIWLVRIVLIIEALSNVQTGCCDRNDKINDRFMVETWAIKQITRETPTTKLMTTKTSKTNSITTQTPTTQLTVNTPKIITVPNLKTTNNPTQFTKRFTIFPSVPTNGTTSKTTNGTTKGTTIASTVTTSSTVRTTATANHSVTTSISTATASQTTITASTPTMPPNPVDPNFPWNVTYGPNGNFCIMAVFAGQVDIFYRIEKSGHFVQTGFDIGSNGTINQEMSQCAENSSEQILALNLPHSAPKGIALLHFDLNKTQSTVTLNAITIMIEITADLFPGINSSHIGKKLTLTGTNLDLFKSKVKHSFACKSLLKSNLKTIEITGIDSPIFDSSFINSTFEFRQTNIQAFMPHDQKIDTFMPANVCPDDGNQYSSTIPFVVGGVLLFLMATVLTAYAIGRYRHMRNEKQAYSEM